MVALARQAHPDCRFAQGNLLDLPFQNGTIAGVVCMYAICHFSLEQVEQAFFEIHRVLRPGGIFLCAFHVGNQTVHLTYFEGSPFDLDFMLFPVDQIEGVLKKLGFTDLETTEREPNPDVEYPSDRAYIIARRP